MDLRLNSTRHNNNQDLGINTNSTKSLSKIYENKALRIVEKYYRH